MPIRYLSIGRALLAATIVVACVSCGTSTKSTVTATSSSTSSAPSSVPGALKLSANPYGELAYSTKLLKGSAGQVTIDFTNHSPLPHNVTIAAANGKVLGATPTFRGGSRLLTLDLGPGRYVFYCSVPGHRAAGMQGVLVIR